VNLIFLIIKECVSIVLNQKIFCLSFIVILNISCANIVPPSGGEKDIDPPNLQKTKKIIQPQGNVSIVFSFDEFIEINNWDQNFYISPPVNKPVTKEISKKNLILNFQDSSFLDSVTYNISLNNCIKDNNEGNVLEKLSYLFTKNDFMDTLIIKGSLKDAYSLKPVENSTVMLFDSKTNDSLIFYSKPNYFTRTNLNGEFTFSNLNSKKYKIFAIDNYDFTFKAKNNIAFLRKEISALDSSAINLYSFSYILNDTNADMFLDTNILEIDSNLKTEDTQHGSLEINSRNDSAFYQLIQDDKVVITSSFLSKPHIIKNIPTGKYRLKYIYDLNNNFKWDSGSWQNKIQPEQVRYYTTEIDIRTNWELVLDWL